MTFLNPLVLFGLAAAAIPILLHLLNLRKLKTVEFSTLRFLHELQRTRMRRVRLRQWILLLLRTLLIVFLVLAFSRPALKGSFAGLGTVSARSTLILLLDDSPSMGLRNTGGVIFDQARAAIQDLAGLVQTGDELHLLRLSTAVHGDTSGTRWSSAGALEALRSLPVSNRSYRYSDAIREALKIAGNSSTVNREIYLLTDLQGSHFSLPAIPADSVGGTAPRVRVFLVGFPQINHANAAVTSCAVESRILAQNRPMTINATVRNYGDQPILKNVVSLYLDGIRVAQQSVDLAPRGSSSLTLTAVPKRRGIMGGMVRLEDDVLEIDNSRYFTAAIPETLKVLFAGGTTEETRYGSLALTLSGDSSVAGLFRVHRITDNQLAYTDLQQYDVLVLAAIRSLPPLLASRIVSAVQQGKGLLVFPGPSMNVQEVNAGLLAPLGIPPMTLPAAVSATESGGFVRFEKIDFSHPVFSGMFEREPSTQGGAPSIESPRIRVAATLPSGGAGLTLITLSDGRPFLREYRPKAGRVLVSAVDAGIDWSDFAVRGIFAPLLHRTILYLAATRQSQREALIGDHLTIQIRQSPGDFQRTYVLQSPSGIEERITSQTRSAAGLLTFDSAPAEEPGLYRLRFESTSPDRGAALLQAVPVHPDALESDLQPVSEEALKAFWKHHGIPEASVSTLDAGGSLKREVEETRHGVELWQLFVLLAVLCAGLEMVVARVSKAAVPGGVEHA